MKNLVSRFAKCESGATAIEYGLIAALIGVARRYGRLPLTQPQAMRESVAAMAEDAPRLPAQGGRVMRPFSVSTKR